MPALTVSVAIFMFLVFIPGYVVNLTAGKAEISANVFYEIVAKGTLIFFFLFSVGNLIRFWADKDYVTPIMQAIGGNFSLVTTGTGFGVFALWIVAAYLLAKVLGCLEAKTDALRIASLKRKIRKWQERLKEGPIQVTFEPKEDILKEIFFCYRACGKIPVVTVYTKEFAYKGRVLKYSHGKNPGLLIVGENDAGNQIWVPTSNVEAIQFWNSFADDNCQSTLDIRDKVFFELLHPGLSIMIEEKLRKQQEV